MSDRARLARLVVGLTSFGAACMPTPPTEVLDPSVQGRMAVMSVLREDFESARPRLLELSGRCRSGEQGRRAVLLLAAAELDTGNEAGSPQDALHLARSYLLLPNAPREEVVIARTLYRLAADLGGSVDAVAAPDSTTRGLHVAPRFDDCDSTPELRFRPLPSTRLQTVAGREVALEESLAMRTDSLVALSDSLAALSDSLATVTDALAESNQQVTDLQGELDRIRRLLTSGAERHGSSDRE